jgi:hypothetical protein
VTNRAVAVLAFRVVALWLVANAAISLAGIPYFWSSQAGFRVVAVLDTLLHLLVALGIGVPVWASADWLAVRTFPSESQETTPLDKLSGERLLALAFAILGVFLVSQALPALVNSLALFTQSRLAGGSVLGPDEVQRSELWDAIAKAGFAAAITRLLVGMCLLAGPARLGSAVARLRQDLVGTLAEDAPADQGTQGAVEQADEADETRGSN